MRRSMSRNIIILGDSIAKGVVYSEDKQRYTILEDNCVKRLAHDMDLTVQNLSCMGQTCADALLALEKANIQKGDIVVLEFGGNDSDMHWKEVSRSPEDEHSARVPLAQFTQNMASLIERVRSLGATPVLTTPTPVDADRYFSWVSHKLDPAAILHWLGDVQHIYRWQERYANAVRKVASLKDVILVDMRDAFLSQRNVADLLCRDGIHPNARGHEILYHTAIPYLSM